MEREELLEKLRKKDPAESYAAQVYEEHILLTDLLDILETEKTAAKYMAEKIVRYISEDRPQLLYPCFDRLFALLDSDNAFIRKAAPARRNMTFDTSMPAGKENAGSGSPRVSGYSVKKEYP